MALETEGAIGKHEPFDLQTATETSRHGSSVLCRMGSLQFVNRVWGMHGLPIGGHERQGPYL
jgi:hypothetical protein